MRSPQIKIYLASATAAVLITGLTVMYNSFALERIALPDTSGPAFTASNFPMEYPDNPPPAPHREIPHLNTISRCSNDFAFKILQQNLTSQPHDNIAVSPVSLAQPFYLAANGAAGETRTKLNELLGINTSWADINQANDLWLDDIKQVTGITLNIATAVWTSPDISINASYQQAVNAYDAKLIDLAEDPQQAVTEINDWVSSNTRGLIRQIVDRLDPETNLVLTNAVYFFGHWTQPFDKQNTRQADFHLPEGTATTCQMMSLESEFNYAENDDLQIVRLPYGAWGSTGMMIMLPKTGTAADVLKGLNAEQYTRLRNLLKESPVLHDGIVEIPKFKLESQPRLTGLYSELGIAPSQLTNFSGISPALANNHILDIAHKVVVRVDETGTEAAGATAIGFGMMAMPTPEPPFHFRADRPFLFFIEDPHGVMLFAGIVNNPAVAGDLSLAEHQTVQ